VPERQDIIDDFFADNDIYYQVIYAGRRSGKSETCKRILARIALTSDKGLPIYIGCPSLKDAKRLY
jgi:hypothetical protein